jgi:hypothetical protein
MIKFSYEELLLFVFLGPIFGVAMFNLFVFLIRITTTAFVKIKDSLSFEKKMKEVNRRKKEEGFIHEWVIIKNPQLGELMVCKATGFCPKLYGFFEIKWIKEYLETEKKAEQIVNERQEHFKKKLEDLSVEFNIEIDRLQNLSEKILKINKDFTIKKLEDLQNEIKPKDV